MNNELIKSIKQLSEKVKELKAYCCLFLKSKKICYDSQFAKTVATMSDDELQENLALVKEWLEESQGDGFTNRQKETLSIIHNTDIEIIQEEINKRQIKGTN